MRSMIHRDPLTRWRWELPADVVSRMDELATLHPDQVFLRREALEHGYTDKDLRRALRAGSLARVRHGAYVPAAVWSAADEVQRHRLKSHAVLRSHGSALALSHTSAAVEHGLRLYKPDLSKVHVVCLGTMLGNATPDLVYHRMPVTDDDIVLTRSGLPAVTPLRAGLDTASLMSVSQGVVVLDSLVDLGIASVEEIREAFGQGIGPRSRRLQVTVRLVRKGANSVAESLMRCLFWNQHIPEPVLQFEVYDEYGHLLGSTDFAWPEYGLLGEFDGEGKYLRLRRQGETIEQTIMREKRREDRLREITGWLMIRLVWADLFAPTATAERVRRQLLAGKRLLAA